MSNLPRWGLPWMLLAARLGCGSDPPQVVNCVERLQGPDQDARAEAARELGEMTPADRSAVFATLARQFGAEDWEDRARAAQALGEVALEVRPGPACGEGSGKPEEDDPGRADVESRLAALAPEITTLLGDRIAQVRLMAAVTMVRMPVEDKKAAVWELSELFLNGAGTIRYRAMESLREAGPDARPIVPRIRYFLCSARPDVLVCRQIAEMLENVGPEGRAEAVAVLREVLRDAQSQFHMEAAITLGEIGPDAKAAVPELTQCLKNNDAKLASEAARALKRIEPASKR